jgi:hypothetical protein
MSDDIPRESAAARQALEAFLDRLAKAVADRLIRAQEDLDRPSHPPDGSRGDGPRPAR